MTIFWRKFSELCDNRGVKPRDTAAELGISATTVAKWLNGGMPNLKMICKIAEYFDVTIDYLLKEDVPGVQQNPQRNNNEYREIIDYLNSLPLRERRRAILESIELLEDNFPKNKKT